MLNLAIVSVVSTLALADDSAADQAAATQPARVVAARVDDSAIYMHEVQQQIARVLGRREIAPEARPVLEAETLEQLIARRLIVRYLERQRMAASEQDLEAEIDRIERQLAQQNLTLPQYLQRASLTRDDLKEALRWEKSWGRYLERHLSDENLERFFERRRREFDGTELQVAHILLRPAAENDLAALAETIQRAAEIRGGITTGNISFAEAAQKHSVSPTAEQGGDIGLIGRRGPMPEPFSAAAFALEAGELSEPVVTPFGVHLIRVLDVKPGSKTWKDVRPELEAAVTRYLFAWIADQQRPHSQIEYTSAMPHFKPGTKQLAE